MNKSNLSILEDFTDEELIPLLGTTHHKLMLNEIYDRYEKRIYYKCISMLRDSHQAKDVTHDIFITIFTKLNQFKGNSKLSLWIHSISVNTCLKYLQQKKKMQIISTEDTKQLNDIKDHGELEIEEKLFLEIRIEELQNFMEILSHEERLVIIMKYSDGLTVKEISNILEVGESAVKMKLKRSRDKLFNLFKEKNKKQLHHYER